MDHGLVMEQSVAETAEQSEMGNKENKGKIAISSHHHRMQAPLQVLLVAHAHRYARKIL